MGSKMMSYIVKRILLTIVTILLIITITFFMMHAIPGGPFLSEKAVSEEVTEALNAKYGLDKPLLTQYLTYLGDVLHFDFGPSLKSRGRDVVDIIKEGFMVSGKIGIIAAAIAIVAGITFGSIAAINRNKLIDNTIMVGTTAFVAMPSFVIGSFFLLILCVTWQIFPANGDLPGGLILPTIVLALYPTAYITRLTRSSMLDVLQQDYIRTARAKGVPYYLVIFKHALKNALIPVITYVGPMIAYILTGSMVVEQIFSVPGLGTRFISCITNRDYPVIMGTTIFLATLVVVMNLISDILYKVVDPRIDFS